MAVRKKAGTSKAAAAARRETFAMAFIANGRNATEAAITAGFSRRSAHTRGLELVKDREVAARIEELGAAAAAAAGITIERAMEKLERVTFSDPRKLYNPDGTPKGIHELDDDIAAAVAGRGLHGIVLLDAVRGLDMTFKHLGLFEKDNIQSRDSLALTVEAAKPVKR